MAHANHLFTAAKFEENSQTTLFKERDQEDIKAVPRKRTNIMDVWGMKRVSPFVWPGELQPVFYDFVAPPRQLPKPSCVVISSPFCWKALSNLRVRSLPIKEWHPSWLRLLLYEKTQLPYRPVGLFIADFSPRIYGREDRREARIYIY